MILLQQRLLQNRRNQRSVSYYHNSSIILNLPIKVVTSLDLICKNYRVQVSIQDHLLKNPCFKGKNMKSRKLNQNKFSIILLLAGIFLTSTIARAAAGDVDLSFSNANITPTFSRVNTSVIQTDGKIVVGGPFTAVNGATQIGLARLNIDGTLDPTFNSPFEVGSTGTEVYALAIQPDGKILVGGSLTTPGNVTQTLLRVNTDGSIDASFVVNPQDVFGSVRQIVFQNGTIYVSGAFSGVTRLNIDGSLIHKIASSWDSIKFAVQPDGSVVMAVAYSGGAFVTRILDIQSDPIFFPNSWGKNDPTYSTALFDSPVGSLTLQPDGKVVVCGHFANVNSSPLVFMARLTSGGAVDATFNANMNYLGNGPQNVTLQPDGKLIVVGSFSLQGEPVNRGFARLNTDGSDDQTFFVPMPDRNTGYSVSSAALQTDGKIIITGGFPSIGSIQRTYIARLLNDDSPTPTPTPTPTPLGNTPVGSNVTVDLGGIALNFEQVAAPGNTVAIPGNPVIPPNPVIPLPVGYSVYRDLSYDITTTASTTGLITVSFDVNSLLVPGNPVTPQIFSRLRVFHAENGVFVDRTIPGNPVIPPNPVLVGRVSSLSPFVIGLLNDAPTLDPIAAQTVMQGNTLSLTATGHDIDEEQTLTYSLAGNTYGANIDAATGAFNWTPGVGQTGAFTFTVNASDNGTPVLSAQQQFTVNVTANPALTLPNTPTNLAASAVSKSQINLSWTDNSNNENGFTIERCTPKGKNCIFAQIAQVGANVRTFSNTGLSKGSEYHYRVRAFNGVGTSSYSNITIARTPAK